MCNMTYMRNEHTKATYRAPLAMVGPVRLGVTPGRPLTFRVPLLYLPADRHQHLRRDLVAHRPSARNCHLCRILLWNFFYPVHILLKSTSLQASALLHIIEHRLSPQVCCFALERLKETGRPREDCNSHCRHPSCFLGRTWPPELKLFFPERR